MKKLLYKFILLSFSILLINSDSFAADKVTSDKSVQLISASESGIRFSVDLKQASLIPSQSDKSGAVSSHTVTIAVPVGAKVEVESVQGYDRQSLASKGLSQSTASSTHSLVTVGRPFMVRGRKLVNVELFPITSSGYYATIEVGLRFIGGAQAGVGAVMADPHFDRLLSKTVVNFDQAQNWVELRRVAAKAGIAANPFGETSDWYRIAVPRTSIYKISGSALSAAGLNSGNVSSSSIRVFNGGGLPLPLDNSVARPEFQEIAIIVNDGGDGIFDASDYILFFGEGVDRWIHAPLDSFINNPYESDNQYWLTASPSISGTPRRMSSVNYGGPIDTTVNTYRRLVHTERDEMLQRYYEGEIFDYYNWYWTDKSSLTIHASTPGAKSGTVSDLFLAGKTFGTHMSLFVGGIPAINKNCNNNRCTFSTLALRDGLTQLVVNLSGNQSLPPYFDYVDVAYSSRLLPQGDKIDLTLGTVDGGALLNIIDNFSGAPTFLDVSDAAAPRLVNSVVRSGGLMAVSVDLSAANYSRLYVDTLATDVEITAVSTTDVRSDLSQVDFLIIGPERFLPAVQEYATYRSGSHRTRLVSVEEIIDNFSFGLYDPTAIRDYLHFAYDNFAPPAPTYVLFVGDGSFDFADILQTGQDNFVPPFVHSADTQKFYSDDNYVYFGNYGLLDGDTSYVPADPTVDRGYDMITARWPVSTTDEIAIIIDKIKNYESKENRGAWRSKVTVVADDEFAAGAYNEAVHTEQAESLFINYLPSQFSQEKIYLWDYPRVGSKRPEVNDAIVDAFNDGTLLINYVGHG
ncbi:MAG: C25 family cysteine peptidase, partial [bacterium]|nr:C25 family cysteine peptidase [bacterium]